MKRFIAIFFTLIILISNVNLTLGMHLCGGNLFDSEFMIGHEHMTCGMESMDVDHTTKVPSNELSFTMKQCCDNDYVSLDTEDTIQKTNNLENVSPLTLAVVYVLFDISHSSNDLKKNLSYNNEPLKQVDRQILHQVFII